MLLKGKKGIISGALDENSIAWKVAERCFEEGAKFTLTNAPIALRMGKINELSEKQLEYAANDVVYLHKIKSELEKMLIRENRIDIANACFDFISYRTDLDLLGWQEVLGIRVGLLLV